MRPHGDQGSSPWRRPGSSLCGQEWAFLSPPPPPREKAANSTPLLAAPRGSHSSAQACDWPEDLPGGVRRQPTRAVQGRALPSAAGPQPSACLRADMSTNSPRKIEGSWTLRECLDSMPVLPAGSPENQDLTHHIAAVAAFRS